MSPGELRILVYFWNAFVLFIAIYYLAGEFWKAFVVGAFVLISSMLNFGARWLTRGGFAVAILACLVYVGFVPEPGQWADLVKEACASLRR